MKTRLSAEATEAACRNPHARNAQANRAGKERMDDTGRGKGTPSKIGP